MGGASTKIKIALTAAVTAVLVSAGTVGATGALRGSNGEPAPIEARAGAASPTESGFVPVTPCRIVNTQNPAGKLGPSEARSYRMSGNTSSQGGAAACGIPATASALEVSVSVVAPEGAGYLRIYPAGVAEPQATFLNYVGGVNTTNAGTVRVTPGGGSNLVVKNHLRRTHVIVDVLGYYTAGLMAVVHVDAAGATPVVALARHNGAVSATRHNVGEYTVRFGRNVTGCAYNGTFGMSTTGNPIGGKVSVAQREGQADSVWVEVFDVENDNFDHSFHLTVTC